MKKALKSSQTKRQNYFKIFHFPGILAAMHERPAMAVVIAWIDVETLLLLFGMMILVAILSQTGVFDYLAVYAFKVGK